LTLNAAAADTGKRLDTFLHERLPAFSRSRLQTWIKEDRVLVNGVANKASYLLRGTEIISVEPASLPPLKAQPEDLPLDIVYEDRDVIVVNKPAGMVVHAGAGNHSGTLVNALLHHFGQLSSISGELRPGIVHRIDRETSGLLVIARTDTAHQSLARQFHDRTVDKTYLALVHGRIKAPGRIASPVTRDPVRRTRMTCKLGTGRAAVTDYRPIEDLGRFTLLDVKIGTGRTHQIRVHLASIHHPIVGDRLYGAPANVPGLPPLGRFFLHAHRLGFRSPSTGAWIGFESPISQDFAQLLASLRSGAARMEASR
jgi:23S rRNA pseudouridine1911/1915/1917 synthase